MGEYAFTGDEKHFRLDERRVNCIKRPQCHLPLTIATNIRNADYHTSFALHS